MTQAARLLGARLSGGWFGWLAFVVVFGVTTAGVASGPLFLEGVGDALAGDALLEGPAVDAVVRIRSDVELFGDEFHTADEAMDAALAGIDLLEPGPTTLSVGARRTSASSGDRLLRSQVRLVARDGAIDALEVVEQGTGPGVWIGERVAEVLEVGAGGTVVINDPEWSREVSVAGVYRDLDLDDPGPYWGLAPVELRPKEQRVFGLVEPELFIVDESTFFEIVFPLVEGLEDESSISLGVEDFTPLSGRVWWQSEPVEEGTGAEFLALGADLRLLQASISDPTASPGAALFAAGLPRAEVESELFDLASRVIRAKNQIDPAIASVEITVVLVGLAVVGLGGWFVARRRGVELRLWTIEGRSPWNLGAWAAVGAVPAAIVGALMGAGLSPWLVRVFGPSPTAHPESIPIGGVVLFVLAGLGLVGLTSTFVALRILDQSVRSRSLRWAWDLALYGIAITLFVQLLVRDPVDAATGEVDLVAMFFPLAGIGALVAVGLRLVTVVLSRLRRRGRGLGTALFLAWRRVVAAAVASLALLFPIGVAAGVAVFSSALVASLDGALDAKSIVSVGSNVSVRFARSSVGVELPERFSIVRSGTGSAQGQEFVLLMVIDPDSYGAAVPWDPAFGMGLDDVLEKLADASGERVPVIVAGPNASRLPVEGGRRTQSLTMAYEVVGELDAVPLMATDRPTLLIRRDTLIAWSEANPELSGLASQVVEVPEGEPVPDELAPPDPDPKELFRGLLAWLVSTEDEARFVEFLDSIGHPTNLVSVRDDALAAAAFTAPRWAFDYLRLLAFVAMILAIGVFAFSAAERRRRLVLAHALVGRMGVGERAAGAALAIEVLVLIGLATTLGLLAATGLSYAVIGEFDPLPSLLPALRVATPAAGLLVAGAVALGAGLLVWWFTYRTARRADVSEVLRVG